MTFTIPTDIPNELARQLISASARPWDTRPRLRIIGDAISQLINACLPGGAADESLSGRSYRITSIAGDRPPIFWQLVRWAAEALFWYWDRGDHCQLAFWEDIFRARARVAAANTISEAVALLTFEPGDSLPDDSSFTPKDQ